MPQQMNRQLQQEFVQYISELSYYTVIKEVSNSQLLQVSVKTKIDYSCIKSNTLMHKTFGGFVSTQDLSIIQDTYRGISKGARLLLIFIFLNSKFLKIIK